MLPTMAERFPQLEVEDLDDDQRRAVEPILRYAGGIGGPFNASLRSPRLTELQFALGNHLLFETTLSRRLTEMAILVGARVSGSEYEWQAHQRRALEEGVEPAICDALREGRRPEGLGEDEAAVHDLSVELLTRPEVSDATFERAKERLGERGVVEVAHLVGFYGMVALVLKVAGIGAPGALPPVEAPFSG
jgi:4-carboxymuconolactone decarboxylase